MAITIVSGFVHEIRQEMDSKNNPRLSVSMYERVNGINGAGTCWWYVQVYGNTMKALLSLKEKMEKGQTTRKPQIMVVGDLQVKPIPSQNNQYKNYAPYTAKNGVGAISASRVSILDWGSDYNGGHGGGGNPGGDADSVELGEDDIPF